MNMISVKLLAAGEKLIPINANDIGIPRVSGDGSAFNVIVGMVYVLLAAFAVFYIVRAALLFVTAQGDPGQITEARNTIIFAGVGLAASTVVFLALQWVAQKVGG